MDHRIEDILVYGTISSFSDNLALQVIILVLHFSKHISPEASKHVLSGPWVSTSADYKNMTTPTIHQSSRNR